MHTTILLVRHSNGDHVGHALAGRGPAYLNHDGEREADDLALALADLPLAAVCSSPRPRARDTAGAIARPHALVVIEERGLDEMDFGAWTGRTFSELESDPRWQRFNRFREGTPAPGGELMVEAQARAIRSMLGMRERFGPAAIAAVSHADVIRAALAYWMGMPLAAALRLEIRPSAVSIVELGDDWCRIPLVGGSPLRAAQTISSSR
jgi:ribonuclease H / adenosylcobalamin/alpha-ribazole phosphatase